MEILVHRTPPKSIAPVILSCSSILNKSIEVNYLPGVSLILGCRTLYPQFMYHPCCLPVSESEGMGAALQWWYKSSSGGATKFGVELARWRYSQVTYFIYVHHPQGRVILNAMQLNCSNNWGMRKDNFSLGWGYRINVSWFSARYSWKKLNVNIKVSQRWSADIWYL